MRHAEKTGDPSDPNLSDAGRARAAALIEWFPARFGRPDFIYATARSKYSARPMQTVQPLADALGVQLNASYADQDYGALAEALLTGPEFVGRTVLVCWHHGKIPGLLRGLGAAQGSYPNPWDPSVFNVVLTVGFSAGGPTVSTTPEPF